MTKFLSLILLCLFISNSSAGSTLSAEQKLHDFNQLQSIILASYGPLQYKQELKILDFGALNEKYKNLILSTNTNRDFYYTLVQYVSEFQDGHFVLRLPTNLKSQLPISTDLVRNQVLITGIDRKQLTENDFPFAIGDEIRAINDQPVSRDLMEIYKNTPMANPKSRMRIAAMSLFFRQANRMPIESGPVKLTIRRGDSKIEDTVELNWIVTGQSFDELPLPYLKTLNLKKQARPAGFINLTTNEIWGDLKSPITDREFRCSGTSRADIPKDATIIMTEPFTAYYHPTPTGNFGYLRLPHYSPEDNNGEISRDSLAVNFKQYVYAITELEKNTAGLILDQDHNCGGALDHLEDLMGLFTQAPIERINFKLRASKTEYLSMKDMRDYHNQNTITYRLLDLVLNLIKTAWTNGEFLTPKTPITGDGGLIHPHPHPNRYTKPIVMLIDEVSGSGGDAMPALMSANKRAILVGQTTMGLGGHVEQAPTLPQSGIRVFITKSLFFRPDGVAIENNGVAPDISYEPTRNDVLYGFKEYQKFYWDILTPLVEQNQKVQRH